MKIAFVGDIALIGKYDITKNPNAKLRLNNLSKKIKRIRLCSRKPRISINKSKTFISM